MNIITGLSVRVSNFWNSNYTEHESNGDRNKTL